MGRTHWTQEETHNLHEMSEQGLGPQQISQSGKLPGRTYEAIRKQLNLEILTAAKAASNVEPVEPATDTIKLEQIIKLYTTAYTQICNAE